MTPEDIAIEMDKITYSNHTIPFTDDRCIMYTTTTNNTFKWHDKWHNKLKQKPYKSSDFYDTDNDYIIPTPYKTPIPDINKINKTIKLIEDYHKGSNEFPPLATKQKENKPIEDKPIEDKPIGESVKAGESDRVLII